MKKNNDIIRVLKHSPDYRKLLATTTVTGLTTWGSFISMLVLLGKITDNGLQLGTLWAVSGLVPIAMSFILGGLIDRMDTKKIIVVSELLKSPLYALFILVPVFDGWAAWIFFFVIRFFIGVLSSLTAVARQTIIPEIMEEEDLIIANSLNFSLNSLIRLIGAASGGVLVTLLNLNVFWILTSLSFIYAGITMWTLNLKNSQIKPKERNFLSELKIGLSVVKKQIYIRYVLLFALTGGLIAGSFNLMIQQMVNHIYHVPPIGISMLYVGEGLTSVILGLWIANNKIFFKNIHRYGYSYILMGLTWAVFGLSNNLFEGTFIMVLHAFVGGFIVPFERHVMQTHVESNLRGRVFGLWNTCSMVSVQFGAFLTGIIIQYLGLRSVTPLAALLEIVLGIVFFFRFRGKKLAFTNQESFTSSS
ncbi:MULTISPECIES: MFS transporter [Heyndrickxia]|uniref:MFS transporter n=1 Tax=Heyndrickxia TaxID=2837504 RepID=UPI00042A06AC|nr:MULTISPECIES: MFS transporter [Heyndrickxia]